MKIRIEQLNPTVGDLAGNKSLILNALQQAQKDGIELLILPEMTVTGYPVEDLLEEAAFRQKCYQTNREIVESTGKTALLFGSITQNDGEFGRKMYNSALLAQDQKVLDTVHKTLLPTYDIFDDLRYFEPNREFRCIDFKGLKLGVTICEDIWYNENEIQYHTYPVNPARELKNLGADVIINISASPYTNTKHQNRVKMLQNHARNLSLPLLYSNQVGAHTDVIFDGDSMAITKSGDVVARTEPFWPDSTDVVLNAEDGSVESINKNEKQPIYPGLKQERQLEAIKLGLRDYIRKTGVTDQVLFGLSGGIDSAVGCALAVEALSPDQVKAITLPAEFSSEGSVTDSQKLAENLGIELFEVPIRSIFEDYRSALKPVFEDNTFGVTEENLQSRIRGTILMAYANKTNSFLIATGNKSEYAVGYATLYGDMNGALSLIGDLYKTEVYEMAKWLNSSYYRSEVIPEAIINKAPSAELRPGQKDSDSLPDYAILDAILYQYLELQKGRSELIDEGFDEKVVDRILRLVDYNEFKRNQAVPILKLGSKSFGSGRRWPIVQKWTANRGNFENQ
ncbi:NAD+ synthase [Rhodohalobacter barkolensis]|uniref:Glutamine-dependent NAD(+) synthetase n=1 Tax=Rhodohalobacter barkolensis TaxID=2053187 RepID=A0A2N0VIC8_9BACT|nr:NAD+ synthase [Rhodohalobacter barkolensis]PKD43941.1 NAD+ synthase [Rhodohalobacter barkolensis]